MELKVEEFESFGFDLTIEEFSSLNKIIDYSKDVSAVSSENFNNLFFLDDHMKKRITLFMDSPADMLRQQPEFHQDYTSWFFDRLPSLFPLNNANKEVFIRTDCLGPEICDQQFIRRLGNLFIEKTPCDMVGFYYLDEWLRLIDSAEKNCSEKSHEKRSRGQSSKVAQSLADVQHKIKVNRDNLDNIAVRRDKSIEDVHFIIERMRKTMGDKAEDLSGICSPLLGMVNKINNDAHKIVELKQTIDKLHEVERSKSAVLADLRKKNSLKDVTRECEILKNTILEKKNFSIENSSFELNESAYPYIYSAGSFSEKINDLKSVLRHGPMVKYKGSEVKVDISVILLPFSGFRPDCIFRSDGKDGKALRSVFICPLYGMKEPEILFRNILGQIFWTCAEIEKGIETKDNLFSAYKKYHEYALKNNQAAKYNINSAFAMDLADWINSESRGEKIFSQRKREIFMKYIPFTSKIVNALIKSDDAYLEAIRKTDGDG